MRVGSWAPSSTAKGFLLLTSNFALTDDEFTIFPEVLEEGWVPLLIVAVEALCL